MGFMGKAGRNLDVRSFLGFCIWSDTASTLDEELAFILRALLSLAMQDDKEDDDKRPEHFLRWWLVWGWIEIVPTQKLPRCFHLLGCCHYYQLITMAMKLAKIRGGMIDVYLCTNLPVLLCSPPAAQRCHGGQSSCTNHRRCERSEAKCSCHPAFHSWFTLSQFPDIKVEIFFPPVKRRQRREKQKICRLQRPVFSSSVNAWICHLLGWKFEEGDSLAGEGKADLSTRCLVNRIFFPRSNTCLSNLLISHSPWLLTRWLGSPLRDYVDDTGMMIIVLADDKKLSNGMMNDVGQIGNLFRQKWLSIAKGDVKKTILLLHLRWGYLKNLWLLPPPCSPPVAQMCIPFWNKEQHCFGR